MNRVAPDHIQTLSVDALYAALRTGPDGLDAVQARRRLVEFGPNRLQAAASHRRWREFFASFTHFFALVLWLAAALAFALAWRDPASGLAPLGYAILAVIVLNGLFSYWQAFQAERAIAALAQLLPQRVRLRRDGAVCELPAEAVVPGDLLLLSAGDRVPADCRLIAGFGVQVDSSALTGEALPGPRSPEPREAIRDSNAGNLLQAGTVLLARAYGFLGPLQAMAAMAAWYLILRVGGWQWGQALANDAPLYRQATTACLAGIVVLQVVNVFVCRNARQSLIGIGLGGNRLLWWGVGLELLLLLGFVYTPLGNALLGTAALPGWLWLSLLPLALALLLADEGRKALARILRAHSDGDRVGQH